MYFSPELMSLYKAEHQQTQPKINWEKNDVFSTGLTLIETWVGYPNPSLNVQKSQQDIQKILEELKEKQENKLSFAQKGLWNLLEQMTHYKPDERPTFEELKDNMSILIEENEQLLKIIMFI